MGLKSLINLASKLAKLLGISGNMAPEHISSTAMSSPTEYLQFLIEVLQATDESQGDKNRVYLLLRNNQDKLDEVLRKVLQAWGTETLRQLKREQADYIAVNIANFSNLIWEFPQGNRSNNLEIAITGYKVVLSLWTREDFPLNWAATQNNLGNAYRDRLKEDKAENLELAISFYQQALLVRTQKDFPLDWAMTQNNLANAYSDRLKRDKAENLELAISCYQLVLGFARSTQPTIAYNTHKQ